MKINWIQEARAVDCLYATKLTGWNAYQTKSKELINIEVDCNNVCDDFENKKKVGKYG